MSLQPTDIPVVSRNQTTRLTVRSQQLQRQLSERNYTMSREAHSGIWVALYSEPYAECFPHAALSARALMNHAFIEIAGLPTEKRFGEIISDIQSISNKWKKISIPDAELQNQFCQVPTKLIKATTKFATKFDDYQTRPKRVDEMLMKTDPSGQPIPENLRKEMVDEWVELDRFFNNILHHYNTTNEQEIIQNIIRLEDILLEYILHSTSSVQNLDDIDQLIAETEAS